MRRALLVSAGLLTWQPSAATAQCADGSPPPCASARRGVTTSRTPPPSVRARRFLLLPFRNVTRGAPQEWLVTGAPLMFGSVLGEFRDLYVVPEERVTAARRRLGLAPDVVPDATQLRRLAEETDGWTAVTGNVFASGGRLRITVQALDVMTSRVIVRAEQEVAADADVRDAFDRLGVSLLEAAGVPAATPDLRALTTRSVDAYRAFVQGVAFYQQSAFRRAEASFTEAVQLDSTFALAWAALATASAGTGGLQAMVNPGSLMYRAVEQAARNAARLPPRQAQFIRSMQAVMHGQISRARRLADSLVATDPDDLDVRTWLASVELFVPMVDTTVSPPRPKVSMNRWVALVRDVLERDPGRRSLYLVAMYGYGLGAGLWWGELWAYKQDAASFGALLMHAPNVRYIPIMGDSIALMLRSEFDRLPTAEQTRIRRRNADAAMEWVERWLVAGPEDAEAHLWAARIADLRDDFPRALRELAVAESIGVESSLENVTGLRLQLLVRGGQYATAGAVADSLLTAGALATKPFLSWLDRRRPYAAAALLLSKRWARAAALGDLFGAPAAGQPACGSLRNEIVGGDLVPALAAAELRQVMDTVALHFGEALAVSSLARCVETLASALVVYSLATRRTVASAALLAAADSLHSANRDAAAYQAARAAWNSDSARHGAIASREWFVQRSRMLALGRGFVAGSAVVDGDSAVFTFRRVGTDPLMLDSPGLATNWVFRIVMAIPAANDTTFFVVRLRHSAPPTTNGSVGGLVELIAAMQVKEADRVPERPDLPVSSPTVTVVADGLRVVVRGPFVVEMRRMRPATAVFSSSPCVAVGDGLCSGPSVTIEYR